jgi:arabinose-5-phosphate isomerase
MAATLASTGTPSFYLHPAEGIHGDLGMVTGDDVVIALSNSGETTEVLNILPSLRRIGAKDYCHGGILPLPWLKMEISCSM